MLLKRGLIDRAGCVDLVVFDRMKRSAISDHYPDGGSSGAAADYGPTRHPIGPLEKPKMSSSSLAMGRNVAISA